MAKIILNIPDNEFGVDIQNKFQDFFGRVKAEIDNRVKVGDTLICGAYEIETAEMFLKAFGQMEIVDDSTLEESSDETIRHLECDTKDALRFAEIMKKRRLQVVQPNSEQITLNASNDCVSRQMAIMCLTQEWNEKDDKTISKFIKKLKALPPATPTHCIAAVRFSKEDLREICNERIEIECTHGTCKDCANYVMGALDEEICLRGHELIHKDFYCADYEKAR